MYRIPHAWREKRTSGRIISFAYEESMHMMHNEEDTDSETEDYDNSTPELIVRNRDPDADSMDSDEDASTSMKTCQNY